MEMERTKPPILSEIRAQHEHLTVLLSELLEAAEEAASSAGEGARVKTVSKLTELAMMLPEHFAHEEEGGYLRDALALAPQLSRRAETLEREHGELTRQLEGARAETRNAAASEALWRDAGHGVRSLVEALKAHEHAENELVRQALTEDLGGGA